MGKNRNETNALLFTNDVHSCRTWEVLSRVLHSLLRAANRKSQLIFPHVQLKSSTEVLLQLGLFTYKFKDVASFP